jgi:flavodoxin
MAMRACVIYDSRFGNTEKVARSLESGLKGAGIETVCGNEKDIVVASLNRYDVVCIGAPTEQRGAYKPMKDFLVKLKTADLSGKYAFAFDTKADWRLSGSAAKQIEKEMKHLGLRIIAPRESAMVLTSKEGDRIIGARLMEGEERRFVQIGLQIGTNLTITDAQAHISGVRVR